MTKKKEPEAPSQPDVITFRCRACEESKPLDEMVLVTRFFPPIAVCRDCERKMR